MFIEEITPTFELEEYVSESLGDAVVEEKQVIKGSAEPGSIVRVMWKSHILSSTVIADASQGEFELAIPEDLEIGDHEILVFVFDEENSLVSNVTALLFRK